jgi:hypothetical protein
MKGIVQFKLNGSSVSLDTDSERMLAVGSSHRSGIDRN